MKIVAPFSRLLFPLSLAFSCCYLTSCTPALLLVVKNRTKSPAYFSIHTSARRDSDSVVTRTLSPKGSGKNSHVTIYCGMGLWGDASFAQISRKTKRLEIRCSNDTILLTDSVALRQFFAHRKPFLSRLVLTIR